MEMKYVVPDMAQSFGTLEFAGESEPVFEKDKNNRRVLTRRSYNLSQHIIDLVDGLEETYYIADVLPKPKEFQNEAYYYAIKKACKSMNDEISKITEEKQEYQEYVESFAHEIKIPIDMELKGRIREALIKMILGFDIEDMNLEPEE